MLDHLLPSAVKTQLPFQSKLHQLLKTLPVHAMQPFTLLPNWLQEKVLTKALNQLFKQSLIDGELDFLADSWLAITLTDNHYDCFITLFETNDNNAALKVVTSIASPADVSFSADINSLLTLVNKSADPDTLFFQRKLLVTGDTELGLEIKNFLDDLEMNHLPAPVYQLLNHYLVLVND